MVNSFDEFGFGAAWALWPAWVCPGPAEVFLERLVRVPARLLVAELGLAVCFSVQAIAPSGICGGWCGLGCPSGLCGPV